MNEVEVVVKGTNRFTPTSKSVEKQIDNLRKVAADAQKSAAGLNDEISEPTGDAYEEVKEKVKDLGDGVEEAAEKTEKSSARSKKAVKELADEVDDAGKKSKDAGDEVGEGAEKAAGGILRAGGAALSFIGSIPDAIGDLDPRIKGALTLAGLSAAAAAGPLIGGALAGGVVLGFGAGITGIAIAAAAQNNEVRQEFSDLWRDVKEGSIQASVPLEGVLIRFAGRARTTFNNLRDDIGRAVRDTAPEVERFSDSLLKGLAKFEPAIEPLSRAFGKVIDDLGPTTERVLAGISDALTDVAESVERNPEALGDFVEFMGDIVEGGLDVVRVLNEWWDVNKRLFDIATTPLEWVGLKSAEDGAQATKRALTEVTEAADVTRGPVQQLDDVFRDFAESEKTAADFGQAVIDTLNLMAGRAPSYEQAVQDVNDAVRDLGETFDEDVDKTKGWGDALLNENNTINTTTENGSKLRDTILELQTGFGNMAGATKELEERGYSHSEALRMVNDDMLQQREGLLETAGQMGLTREQMGLLLQTYGLTPDFLYTTAQLEDDEVKRKIEWITKLRTVVFRGVLDDSQIPNARPAYARAHGGVSAGGWTKVGEMGEEMVRLPPGAQVMPHTQGSSPAGYSGGGAGGAGGPVVLEVVSTGGSFSDFLAELIRQFVRVHGRGDVQEAFGEGVAAA